MADDGLLYVARAGTIGFKAAASPVVVAALFVPNKLNKTTTDSVVEVFARVAAQPFAVMDWGRLCQKVFARPFLSLPQPSARDREVDSSDVSQQLIEQVLGTLSKCSDARLLACVAWPHDLLTTFRDIQKQPDASAREPLVWKHAMHMVLQRAHMCLNDRDLFCSVIVDHDNTPVRPALFELLKAPGYDRYITYRKFVETLAFTERQWSPLLQCAHLLAELLLVSVREDGGRTELLNLINGLWHRGPDGEIVQAGLIALPKTPNLISNLTNISKQWT